MAVHGLRAATRGHAWLCVGDAWLRMAVRGLRMVMHGHAWLCRHDCCWQANDGTELKREITVAHAG
eukprot:8470139-Lingulodinium_polyedra.AAC.1